MSTLLILLLACAPGKLVDDDDDGTSDGTSDDTGTGTDGATDSGGTGTDGDDSGGTVPDEPTLTLRMDWDGIVDPLRQDEAAIGLDVTDAPEGATITLMLLYDDGTSAGVLADGLAPGEPWTWDLADPSGAPLASGPWTLKGVLMEGSTVAANHELPVHAVRTALTEGRFGGPDVDDDGRIALLWHDASGVSGKWDDGGSDPNFRVDGLSTGGGTEEQPTQVPAVWTDLATPPDSLEGANLPVAYPYDARPLLSLELAHELGEVDPARFSAAIDGWTLVAGDLSEGPLVFQRDTAVADAPRVVEEALTFTLRVDDVPFTSQALPVRFYATMGAPTFTSSSSPHLLWVQAADEALHGIEGVAADDRAVLSALVEWVYDEADVRYDTTSGASFYMSYGRSWSEGFFAFESFLKRSNGEIVNCSDCSGIMGVFANMLGVELDYAIILSNFQLNEIKAIGVDDYTSCPFGPRSCGFSYHAVTTDDDGGHIWDATLALDGDEDPGDAPHEELMVQEITGDEYLERLVRSGSAGYYYADSRVRIR